MIDPGPDAVRRHEAAHAATLLWTGHGIDEVRVDGDLLGRLGVVRADFTKSVADYGFLISLIAGPLAEGRPPPLWPLDPDAEDGDERSAAALCDFLELDAPGYVAAAAIADFLIDTPVIAAAIDLLCRALRIAPVMSGEQVREVLGERLMARLQPEEETCST